METPLPPPPFKSFQKKFFLIFCFVEPWGKFIRGVGKNDHVVFAGNISPELKDRDDITLLLEGKKYRQSF